MLATAEKVLGHDILKLCLDGPKEKLDDTAFSQPALYIAGLAAVERLRAEDPAAVNNCSATAGRHEGRHEVRASRTMWERCISCALRYCITVLPALWHDMNEQSCRP